jgi:hypothetical protein
MLRSPPLSTTSPEPSDDIGVRATPATEIDALVRQLRELYVGAGVQLSIDIGRLIIERLFGGDLERWRARGRKDVSFRKLEKHPDLPFHASTLSRAVSVYMLEQRRNDLTSFRHVTPSHLQEIAMLGDGEQDRLLEKVESEKWSMRRLRQEVAGMLGASRGRHRRGAVAVAPWLRRIHADLAGRSLVPDQDTIAHLELDSARELLEITRTVLQQMELLARRLGGRIREIDGGPRTSDIAPSAFRRRDPR